MPLSEVPNRCSPPPQNIPCEYYLVSRRIDLPPVVTPGTPEQLSASTTIDCDNCQSSGTKTCTGTYTFTSTSSLEVAVSTGLEAGPEVIRASLETSVTVGLSVENSVSFGDSIEVPPHKRIVSTATIIREKGRKASITHNYECVAMLTRDLYCPPGSPDVAFAGGTRVSSATATGFSGSFRSVSKDQDCPE